MLVNLLVMTWHGLHCISRAAFFQWRHQGEAIIIYGSRRSQNVNKVRVVSLNLDGTKAKAGRQISSSFQFSWFNYFFFDQNQTATEVLSQKQALSILSSKAFLNHHIVKEEQEGKALYILLWLTSDLHPLELAGWGSSNQCVCHKCLYLNSIVNWRFSGGQNHLILKQEYKLNQKVLI